jgi:hypothetical protein
MFSRRFLTVIAIRDLGVYVHYRFIDVLEGVVIRDLWERVRLLRDDHPRRYVPALRDLHTEDLRNPAPPRPGPRLGLEDPAPAWR